MRRDLNSETQSMGSNSNLSNLGAVGGSNNAVNASCSSGNANASTVNTSTTNANTDSANATAAKDDDESSDTLPTWAQMEHFLDQQAKILRDIAKNTLNMQNQQSNANRNQQKKQNAANPSTSQNASRTNENLPPCLLCRVKHPTYSCPTWKGMSVEDREINQKTNNLCLMCVQPAHGKAPCWDKPNWAKRCPACYEQGEILYHNSTLCRRTEAKRLAKTLTMQFPNPKNNNKKA